MITRIAGKNSFRTWEKLSRKALTFGLVLLLAAGTVAAQNVGKISGTVKDAETGAPLVGCNITLPGTLLGAATDPEGTYFILNVPPGKYEIQASMIGYQKVTQRDAIVNAGRTTVVNFAISSKEVMQQEVVIEATRPDVEKEKTSTSAIVRFDDVQAVAGIRDIGDVLTLAADVTDGHFRGGREGEEYYTLQGMGINNPLDNSSAFMPIMSAVEEVEVITSGFGAQYGNAQSGVVNITMKEGKPDKWRTRFETRGRAPGQKHFGPSVYDPNANPYLSALLNPRMWKEGDPESGLSTAYFTTYFDRARFRGDTAVQVQIARMLWENQSRRDMNLNYGNGIDNSVEMSAGGPIDDNMRMFFALRSNTTYPTFPTEQPDIQRQVMGNIATDFGKSATLRLSGGYTLDNTNVFPSSDGTGFYTWLWDRILGINYQKRTNLQLGARFTQTLSPSTYYELKLNSLWTKRKSGSSPSPISVPDSMITDRSNLIDWDKIVSQVIKGPDGFYYFRGDDAFRDELTRTISFDGSMTSQITKSHLLNGGVQFNTYLLDVSNNLAVRSQDGGGVENYRALPLEGALYAQDKMEFEGLIANVGLRFDVWSSQENYYTNSFNPYTVFDTSNRPVNDPAAAPTAKAPTYARLQPRVGVSFPVAVGTVFHLNYGSFMQRPPFQDIVYTRYQQGSLSPQLLGNPRLEPEVTNSYDIGVMQGLGDGFTLDVSGYYKDVKNLIEQALFTPLNGTTYTTYVNRDYADIRGFRVAFQKRRGAFTGSINYQFGVATGKSATTSNAPVVYIQQQSGAVQTQTDDIPVRDILLDFDRTHNLILNLGYVTSEGWGPEILGGHPFADLTLSTNSFFRSGRPYTSASNAKVINGGRTPGEYNTNARLTKRLPNLFGMNATVYAEVFNLFDQQILNYNYIFSVPNAGSTNNLIRNYEQYPIDDPVNGIRYLLPSGGTPPPDWARVDQSFLIYDNMPRSFNFGFVVEF